MKDAALRLVHSRLAPGARILELGTLRSTPGRPTHLRDMFPSYDYVRSDGTAGEDVDVVADAHALSATFGPGSFDCVIAMSVWEHLRRPWDCAEEVHKVLKWGGLALIATHQTFPLHGYPQDYFRFSAEALRECFRAFDVIQLGYAQPCVIDPGPIPNWNPAAPAYLDIIGVFHKL